MIKEILIKYFIKILLINENITGHPSDNAFNDKSDICEHDSRKIADNLKQCLLNGSSAASVIFLHSVKSKYSMLWQC